MTDATEKSLRDSALKRRETTKRLAATRNSGKFTSTTNVRKGTGINSGYSKQNPYS